MKRLLLPLIAALALPTAANAERVWLIIDLSRGMEKIEVENMAQCEEQGNVFKKSKRLYLDSKFRGYECLKGK